MFKLEFVQIDYDTIASPKQKRAREHECAYSLLDKMLKEAGISSYEILRGQNGKPHLKGEKIHFNLSHTEGFAVVCLSDTEIGVDCEKIDPAFAPKIEAFSKRYFLENELSYLKKNDFSPSCFFEIWTKKEAYIKKYGLNAGALSKIDTTKETFECMRVGEYIISIFK